MLSSIGCPSTGNIKHRAGGEGTIFRREPGHHRGELFDQHALSVEGETERYASSEAIDRVFCKRCGTRLFAWRRNGTLAGVSLSVFDDRNAFAPTEHIWVSEKPAWLKLDDGLVQYQVTIPA